MHRAASFGWAGLVFFALLLPRFIQAQGAQYIGVPSPGPVAPAPDVPESSALPPKQLELPPHVHPKDLYQIKQSPSSGIGEVSNNAQIDQDSPNNPFTLQASFNGIDEYPGNTVADATIAAGPTTLALSTNDFVAIQNKQGIVFASKDLREFFSPARLPDETGFDPRVIFDPDSHRFFLVASSFISNTNCTPGTCISHFLLAVSKTPSPMTLESTDWYFYAFDATLDGTTPTTNRVDFSGIGVDDKIVVLTALMLKISGDPYQDSFQYSKIRILDKSKLIKGEPVTWADFFGMKDPVNGSAPALDVFEAALHFESSGPFFLISHSYSSCGLVVWGITNPLSSPTLSARTVTAGSPCDRPPDAAQPDGGPPLYLSSPLSRVVFRNGSLWVARISPVNFGNGTVSAIRWGQIEVGAWPNSLSFTQDSTFGADGIWYGFPALMVDAANNVAIVFARLSTSEFASVYYTGRLGTDPPNTLRRSKLLKAGMATIRHTSDTRGLVRFADYFGIALDPEDNSFWLFGEYPKAQDQGGTWVGNVIAPAGIEAAFESPDPGPVSGVAVIRGWAFAMQPGVSISKVELFINGVSAGDIPCCSQRADVQAAFPDNPNALNSGWATTFNWGVLDVGSYTVQVVIKNTLGQTLSTETRMVTVVKPGNFEFLDLFSFAQATALIDGDELVLEGVTVRDKATQQQKTIDAHYRWSSSSQSFGLIQSPTLAQSSPAPSLLAAWWSALLAGLKGLTTPTQASPGVIAAFESPEANQLAAGVGVVRGWAFSDTAGASITEVRLVIDGTVAGTVPCCSARADVAAAYPGIATALNSGWGAVFNYGILNAGPHTFGVQLTDSTGATFSDSHGVTVVKLGGFEFLDQCTLSGATAQLQGEDVVLSGVQVRDKATQQSKIVTTRLRWQQSAQALGIVASQE